jgi:homoserine O-succinyltransferase
VVIRSVETPLGPGPVRANAGPARWTCAFVNNMPDSAFTSTERQFLQLLDAGSGPQAVDVRRYVLDGVPRGERTRQHIADHYAPIAAIEDDPPDLLVVTGSDPVQEAIRDEPYWGELADLIEWGTEHTSSMLLSCLAAHGALAVIDGIERTRLSTKCTGVFAHQSDDDHPLMQGVGEPVLLPHSRWNTVPLDAVRDRGYRVALGADSVGWCLVTKDVGHSRLVLVQGHPEYDPASLLAEYRRDVRRYVEHERDTLPCLPLDCAGNGDWEQLVELQATLEAGDRSPTRFAAFDFEQAGTRAPWPWRATAIRLYANWLAATPHRSA